jgi:hypothetical protein
MSKILIAASAAISSEQWLHDNLSAMIQGGEFQIRLLNGNKIVERQIAEMGTSFEVVQNPKREGRTLIEKALSGCDHLLLFWDGRELDQLLFEARLRGVPTKVVPFRTTAVVNRDRGDEFDVYIGRGSPWGNPYVVGKQEGQYDRQKAIELYRADFLKRLGEDPAFHQRVLSLRGYRLACHCKPLACHGDVIAGYLNSLDPRGSAAAPHITDEHVSSTSD